MQTFMTNTSSFEQTARELDPKRLHKQALEAWQCLLTLTQLDPQGAHREPRGWSSHPVVKMWRGHETLLAAYTSAMCFEWQNRGYRTSVLEKSQRTLARAIELERVNPDVHAAGLPAWMADSAYFERLVSTHRRALLVKRYDWYSVLGWPEDVTPGRAPHEYVYVWPHEDGYARGA